MRIKDLVKSMFHAYFVIVTGVTVSMYICCLLFNPQGSFTPDDIGGILLMALISDVSFLIFCSKRELNKKQMLLRVAVHIPVLLAMLLYFAYLFQWVNMKSPAQIAVFILLVLGVYIGTLAGSFYRDRKTADKLNESLMKRYHSS